MKNRNVKDFLAWNVLIAFLALMLYTLIIDPLLDNIYLKKNFAFTISNTVSTGSVGYTGADSKYTFFLNGTWYVGYTQLPLKQDGTKYFIKFYPKNPERNKATTVVATPEDIKKMPPGGYKRLPHE